MLLANVSCNRLLEAGQFMAEVLLASVSGTGAACAWSGWGPAVSEAAVVAVVPVPDAVGGQPL